MAARARPSVATLLALGVRVARRGPIAALGFAASALTALVLVAIAIATGRRDGADSAVHLVPGLASSALAWGGGLFVVTAVASSALRRDLADGTRRLLSARGPSARDYLVARLGGAAVLVALAVGGGTLVVAAGAIAFARARALETVHASFAALVFALAYALVMVPVAFAALGARRRAAGFGALVLLVVLPALAARAASGALPPEVTELCAIPSALAALRGALGPVDFDPFRAARALVALVVFAGVGLFFVRRRLALLQLDAERSP